MNLPGIYLHREALLRTLGNADATLYAFVGIDLPFFVCPVNGNCPIRADLHTQSTVYAVLSFFRIIINFPAGLGPCNDQFFRIGHCHVIVFC